MKKIVVLGSTNTDMVIAGKKIPVPGETPDSDIDFLVDFAPGTRPFGFEGSPI